MISAYIVFVFFISQVIFYISVLNILLKFPSNFSIAPRFQEQRQPFVISLWFKDRAGLVCSVTVSMVNNAKCLSTVVVKETKIILKPWKNASEFVNNEKRS
jgi:hypothetical protein